MFTKSYVRQFCAAAAVLLAVFTSGTCFGWPTTITTRLLSSEGDVHMTFSEASWMIAVIEIGNLFSPIIAGMVTDIIGRKVCVLLTGPVFVLSWVIIIYGKSTNVLCIARTLQGVAFGGVATVVPIYLGEIASPEVRGTLTGLYQSAFYGGMLFEFTVGPYTTYHTLNLLNILFPVLFVASFIWQPESPYYLLIKGKDEEAGESLARLRGKMRRDVTEELAMIKSSIEEQFKEVSWKDVIGSRQARRALLIVNIAGCFKVMTGMPAVISYATRLFQHADVLISAEIATIVMGSVMFVSSFFSSCLSDIFGRRSLLIASSSSCSVVLFVISVYLYVEERTDLDLTGFSWALPLFVIIFCLLMAFGPIGMVYRSEMFPANTRGIAASINALTFAVGAFVTIKFYQVIEDFVGLFFIYFLFSMISVLFFILILIYSIETKGKTLAEVQEEILKAVNKTEVTKC